MSKKRERESKEKPLKRRNSRERQSTEVHLRESSYLSRVKEKISPTLEAVLIDLDGVLIPEGSDYALRKMSKFIPTSSPIDPETFIQVARADINHLWLSSPFLQFAESLGISSTEALCIKEYNGEDKQMKEFYKWSTVYQHEVWTHVLEHYHISSPDAVNKLIKRFQDEKKLTYKPYSEVLSFLAKLKALYKICLITNGAPDLQRLKIQAAHLDQIFEKNIIVSGEIGIGKPDPNIFHLALEMLGVIPERATMIGNSAENDIHGAESANIAGIKILRYEENDQKAKDQESIKDLDELSMFLLQN